MKDDRIHSILLALVGGYMLYGAYHLLENMRSGKDDMPQALFAVMIAAFALAGIAILVYAWHVWRRRR